jgi:hypothetical protein
MYGEYEFDIDTRTTQYYAKVGLEVEFLDDRVLKVDYDPNLADWLAPLDDFKQGVDFGLAYMWEALRVHYNRGFHIKILEVEGIFFHAHPVTLAYATVFALLKALNWTPTRVPTFNADTEEFNFPRWLLDVKDGRYVDPAP